MAGEGWRRRLRDAVVAAGGDAAQAEKFAQAFVHESAVREGRAPASNERLEFLGDAILGKIVAEWLFATYPNASEGELALRKAALVSDAAIADTAERLGFEHLVVLGTGAANTPPARRRSILGDALEAFLAVLHRECGAQIARWFVLAAHIEPARSAVLVGDPKTVLQEWSQKHYTRTPTYSERSVGPAHDATFFAEVSIEGEQLAQGSGPSKKLAQRAAAAAALEVLRVRHSDVPTLAMSMAADAPAHAETR